MAAAAPGALLDDVLAPMRAVLAGHRVVFEPTAHAFDATAKDAEAETRRKIRTLAGNVQILWFEPRLLVPFLNPVWLQYISHKVGRLMVPYALLVLFAASLALAGTSLFYATALFAQAAFYLHGGYGAWLDHWHGASATARSRCLQRTRCRRIHHRDHERVGGGRCRSGAARQEGVAMSAERP